MSEPLILKLQNRIKELENKSAILAISTAQQNTKNGQELIINFNEANQIKGEDLELSENTIICKKRGFIIVSYKIFLDSGIGDGNNIITRLYKNDTEMQRTVFRPGDARAQTFQSEARLLAVAENDVLKLGFINYSSDCVIGADARNYENSINIFYL